MATNTIVIKDPKGKIVFQKDNFSYPDGWSYSAASTFAHNYTLPTENSVEEAVNRITSHFTKCNRQRMIDMVLRQEGSFNSPVMFNFGTCEKPIGSACFILGVQDNMESIADLYRKFMIIYKFGAGAGVSISTLRGSMETLSRSDGVASGPLSFMKPADAIAGTVKSGGRQRRAAKGVWCRCDHPNVDDFIECKPHEEEKARVLAAAGYGDGMTSESYQTVAYQNMNISIQLTDKFMNAAKNNEMFDLLAVKDGRVIRSVNARDMLLRIATAAHKCGDPGVQFIDTINKDNPLKECGYVINGSNPCISGDTLVHTVDGLKRVRSLDGKIVDILLPDGSTSPAKFYKTGKKAVVRVDVVGKNSTTTTPDHRWKSSVLDVVPNMLGDVHQPEYFLSRKCEKTVISDDIVMLGFAFGEGTFHHTHTCDTFDVKFNEEKDGDVIDLFRKEYEFTGTKLSSVTLRSKMDDLGVVSEKLPTRRIPDSILCSDANTIASFLRGLYSANGCVLEKYNRITLKTSSKQIAESVASMLSFLGIRSYITTNKPSSVAFKNGTYDCKQSYDVNISSADQIYRFRDLVGFVNRYRAKKIDSMDLPRSVNRRQRFLVSVHEAGEEDVYDFTVQNGVPYGVFNDGVVLHNCSEFMFYDESACNLASINLNKFYNGETFDYLGFQLLCKEMIFAMDEVIDVSSYPTQEIWDNSVKFRPLGLGYTGLGTVLMRMGLAYGSPDALKFVDTVTHAMSKMAWLASHELYEKYGSNLTETEQIALTAHVVEKFGEMMPCGYRNTQVTLLAPTGTISIIMDSLDATGIEPVTAIKGYKTTIGGNVMPILAAGVDEAMRKLGVTDIEHHPVFATSIGENAVSIKAHLDTMSVAQRWLSGAVSKTVNVPANATPQDIYDLYFKAWELGIKSVAVYRSGSKMNEPLSSKDPSKPRRMRMPNTRDSKTHRFEVMGMDGYITIGYYDDGRIGEVFAGMQKVGSTIQGLLNSWSIMVSNALQYGVPMEDIIRKFKGSVFEPSGITDNPDIEQCSSILDYVVRYIELTLNKKVEGEAAVVIKTAEPSWSISAVNEDNVRTCPECGNMMILTGRCHLCTICGTSGGCS